MSKVATPSKVSTPKPKQDSSAPAKPAANSSTRLVQQANPVNSMQPTDTYIPGFLNELVPELSDYEKLIETEKKLDIYLSRKQIDLYQSVTQWNNSKNSTGAFGHYDSDDIKYLRIFVSNTAENQVWQVEQQHEDKIKAGEDETVEEDTLQPEPTWTMRIEGRLIDDLNADNQNRPKFSSFIKDIAVDFKKQIKNETTDDEDEDDPMNGNGEDNNNINNDDDDTNGKGTQQIVDVVEWHYDPDAPVEFDGLDIKRTGSENLQCTITIQPRGITGNHLQYSPELSMIIGKASGSLHEAVYSMYKYLLINNLLISDNGKADNGKNSNNSNNDNNNNGERTIVQLDRFLYSLLPTNQRDRDGDIKMGNVAPLITKTSDDNNDDNRDNQTETETEEHEDYNEIKKTMKLTEFLPLVNSHIHPLKPIEVNYTIRVDRASTYGELVFDVEVPDPSTYKNKQRIDELGQAGLSLISELETFTKDNKTKLDTMDKEKSLLHLQLNETANKYQFFHKLGMDTVPALEDYISSQANALKILSGDEGFNEDTVRRSQFYRDNENMLFENIGVLLANGRI